MLFNRSAGLVVMLVLLLMGNIFGFYKISVSSSDLLSKYPKLDNNSLSALKIIQLCNIISLVGIWFFQKWGAGAAILLALLVIALDVYYQLWYHIFVVILGTGLLLFFVYKNWQYFR